MDDEPEMHFRGEELRVADDETVLQAYADAREQPGRFAIRFNPNFANFFYPILGRLFS